MPLEMLKVLVKKALSFADSSCTFMFQGGEPTLAGLPFFEKLIEYQSKYNTKSVTITNSIQTNGIMIDKNWADFFARKDFLIGLSLDGTKEIHNQNRIFADESGTFSCVLKTAELFNRTGVQYNILCVVTKNVARCARQVYNFFKSKGFRYLQFIPCLDPLEEERGSNAYSLTSQDYLHFLKTTFDLWYEDIKRKDAVSIRYFDNFLAMAMGQPPEACGMSGICGCQFVTEADGSVYPCDFYVGSEWKIGHILEDSFEDMRFSEVCEQFIEESRHLHPGCKACKWLPLCRGGCKRDRTASGKNYYCDSYKAFLEYSLPRLQGLNSNSFI